MVAILLQLIDFNFKSSALMNILYYQTNSINALAQIGCDNFSIRAIGNL